MADPSDYIYKCKCKHMKRFHKQKYEQTFVDLKSLWDVTLLPHNNKLFRLLQKIWITAVVFPFFSKHPDSESRRCKIWKNYGNIQIETTVFPISKSIQLLLLEDIIAVVWKSSDWSTYFTDLEPFGLLLCQDSHWCFLCASLITDSSFSSVNLLLPVALADVG